MLKLSYGGHKAMTNSKDGWDDLNQDSRSIISNKNAQFMLLSSFIIAIGLVAITVMLNSIIFEGNKAIAAGSGTSKIDIANLIQTTRDEMRYAYKNSILLEEDGAINNFNLRMKELRNYLPVIYAIHGEGIDIAWEDWTDKKYAYFTENGTADGIENWTIMKNIQNSKITIDIEDISDPFSISIINKTKVWQVDFTGIGSRIIDDNEIHDNIESPYSISIVNGANAIGRYNITGNTAYNRNFIRARDYMLNTTIVFSNDKVRANITIPVTVP